ncbi:histidine triad nucleotide-binding protein [Chlorobium phaeobacteroides]|jgi:histidine triad (HIT) family protein|uniref:Histidine triad (HIT) protein n=1 Tax=Chlorobium phaeobacteroides (strain DSM 266 / SMG 266 / 2430) TaxID=290317 RepID=A1BCP8_CHLPD|nr:histidine triad (HIT) protein [Chlorobium phaeobacteroides DSM 266]
MIAMHNSFYNPDCLFCRIAAGEIPADIVYRDEHVLAFRDINPAAPEHLLIIPLKHIASLNELQSEDKEIAGHLLLAAGEVARRAGLYDSGYRMVFNTGADALQSVFHIHGHLIGGCRMGWPPFPGEVVGHG